TEAVDPDAPVDTDPDPDTETEPSPAAEGEAEAERSTANTVGRATEDAVRTLLTETLERSWRRLTEHGQRAVTRGDAEPLQSLLRDHASAVEQWLTTPAAIVRTVLGRECQQAELTQRLMDRVARALQEESDLRTLPS